MLTVSLAQALGSPGGTWASHKNRIPHHGGDSCLRLPAFVLNAAATQQWSVHGVCMCLLIPPSQAMLLFLQGTPPTGLLLPQH